MNNNVRLIAEIVIALVAVVAIGLYFPQRGELADAQATVEALSAANEEQASNIADLESQVADAETASADAQAAVDAAVEAQSAAEAAATEQADMAATAQAAADEAQAAADAAVEAQSAAEAAASEQADMAAAAQADATEQANMAATAMADAEAAQSALAEAQSAAEAAQQQAADLQSTIDAMSVVTPEPEATEAPTEEAATEEAATEAPEVVEVIGFSNDVFSMALDPSYTTFNLSGDDRESSLATISAADADLGARVTRETAHDYAAWQGVGEYILVNQQAAPAGVASAGEIAGVAFRRADSSEVLTLGENEVARGMFGTDEVRYILLDGGSMWVLTFHSADVAGNLAAFDAAVATFNAPEPPTEE